MSNASPSPRGSRTACVSYKKVSAPLGPRHSGLYCEYRDADLLLLLTDGTIAS